MSTRTIPIARLSEGGLHRLTPSERLKAAAKVCPINVSSASRSLYSALLAITLWIKRDEDFLLDHQEYIEAIGPLKFETELLDAADAALEEAESRS